MFLLTGFDPFGALDHNPSATIAAAVSHQLGHHFQEIPTTYEAGWRTAIDAAKRLGVDGIVLFGYAASATGLRLERCGRNQVTSTQPDNDGRTLAGSFAMPGGDDVLPSSTDLDVVLRALADAGHHVDASDDAGGYVCNYTYYRVLRECPDIPVLFIHVGPLNTPDSTDSTIAAAVCAVQAVALDRS